MEGTSDLPQVTRARGVSGNGLVDFTSAPTFLATHRPSPLRKLVTFWMLPNAMFFFFPSNLMFMCCLIGWWLRTESEAALRLISVGRQAALPCWR
ncbi:hypothetical protein GQ55_6G225800 [Panicum hallii var. hallii]|uniref:Uncharacterized protein n=1 Tax=Panicum hallii var. hallii TaxID=1504633 RepID=A0A2T7D8L1_9POAL|nr:hypothetical protein GQ55_6G225800 [Panicum hallii var. hallii]